VERRATAGCTRKRRPSETCEPEWVGAEHPLFLLYTSGSTGKPKGVQHSTGGYLLHAALTTKWTFDLKPTTCSGAPPTSAGSPATPTSPMGRWRSAAPRSCSRACRPTRRGPLLEDDPGPQGHVFYTAPTAIRSLIKAAEGNAAVHPDRYDLTSLRILGSVGEPINPAAWEWYHKHIGGGRCPIVDTFWQTETGGHMITPLPGATPLVPGSCTLPFPGIAAAVVDETGKDVPWGRAASWS
jgi:acetyl-CoA synthetase